jgi:anti-sigma B factor antagonist
LTFTQRVRADGSKLIVALYGEMDFRVADSFETKVAGLIAQRRPDMVHIDMSDLTFLDSTAISAIVRMWRLARREHCSMRVVNPTGVVQHILEVTGVLAIVGDVPAPEAPPRVTP